MNDLVPEDAKLPVALAVGGLLLKAGEFLLKKSGSGINAEQKFRGDLLKENADLRKARDAAEARADVADKRADEWQRLYYALRDTNAEEKGA